MAGQQQREDRVPAILGKPRHRRYALEARGWDHGVQAPEAFDGRRDRPGVALRRRQIRREAGLAT